MGREDFEKIFLCAGNSNAIWPELIASVLVHLHTQDPTDETLRLLCRR